MDEVKDNVRVRRKTPFTLLEVLIAIALTALCAPLLFSLPFRIAKKEIDALFTCEIARIADNESYRLNIDLLSQGPLWKEVAKSDDFPRLLEQKEIELSFSTGQKRVYALKKELMQVQIKDEGKLLQVRISLRSKMDKKPSLFSYFYVSANDYDEKDV